MWPDRFKDAVFVSLGTGSAPSPALEGNILSIAQALKNIVVQTESTADDFFTDHSGMTEQDLLYRFNVYHGLADVGLEEYKESRRIADATHAYMTGGEIRRMWKKCVEKLERNAEQGTRLVHLIVTRQQIALECGNRSKYQSMSLFINNDS